jgi:hypothetical protein
MEWISRHQHVMSLVDILELLLWSFDNHTGLDVEGGKARLIWA